MRPLVLLLPALLLAAPGPAADLVVFVNGDRLSGDIVAKGTRRIRLRTPYGRLEIPRTEIERLVWEDGREEIISAPEAPAPPRTTAELALVITGNTFWHAWDPKTAPADPSLRLVVLLGEEEVATYTDVKLDPDDLPGAVVNSFVFAPERLLVVSAEQVKARAPEPGKGGVQLVLELPPRLGGQQQLVLAYQLNDGTSSRPDWRDVVEARATVDLAPARPQRVTLEQDRGQMEYTDRSMHYVETFRAFAHVASPSP
mgnify:FL=1|jgi:hypothetical protein